MLNRADAHKEPIPTWVYKTSEILAYEGLALKTYYYLTDHLGTPVKMTEDNGDLVWEGEYLPSGELYSSSGRAVNNIRFPGQYCDKETGLHYNYFHYYDPSIGRYLRPDPIGLKGGMNLYAYTQDSPIGFSDARGLKTRFSMHTIGGAQAIVGGQFGSAIATSDCKNGRRYIAKYLVIGIGLGANVRINIDALVENIVGKIASVGIAKNFTLDANYPPRYVSYLDIEGHKASILYSLTFVDVKFGVYEGGRRDISVVSRGLTGEIGAQLFNFQGVHLIRMSLEERCCDK